MSTAFVADSTIALLVQVATSLDTPTVQQTTNFTNEPISAHEADPTALPYIQESAKYLLSKYSNFTSARGFRGGVCCGA